VADEREGWMEGEGGDKRVDGGEQVPWDVIRGWQWKQGYTIIWFERGYVSAMSLFIWS